MDTEQTLDLNVFEGDYGLVSLDLDSLQSILLTKIAKIPVQIRTLNTIKNCTFYSAPSFVHGNLVFRTFEEIVLYLRTLHYSIDQKLSAKQCSETLAISSLVTAKLKPAVEFVYWIDQRNVEEFTNKWFMKAHPIPFNYIYINRLRKKANDLLETMYPFEHNPDILKEYMSTNATHCLSSLSARLGTAEYFYGNSPSTLDVIVYSHIAPLVKLPFPSIEIPNLLSMWPNLTNFVKRIDAKYFPDESNKAKYLKHDEKIKQSDDDISYTAIFILAVSATSLILGFAFNRGFVSGKM